MMCTKIVPEILRARKTINNINNKNNKNVYETYKKQQPLKRCY